MTHLRPLTRRDRLDDIPDLTASYEGDEMDMSWSPAMPEVIDCDPIHDHVAGAAFGGLQHGACDRAGATPAHSGAGPMMEAG